jgi:hypothetical protein
MSKSEVCSIWGRPNAIKTSKNSYYTQKNQEVWHYFGKGFQKSTPACSVVFEGEAVRYVFLR